MDPRADLQAATEQNAREAREAEALRAAAAKAAQEEVAFMVNYLANCKLSVEWQFGKEPYSRANPPPTVCSPRLFFFSLYLLFCRQPASGWPASNQTVL